MMLLQAGQLGLYRKDSIWTSDIPPDMVAGAKVWIDFTDTGWLYSGEYLDGSNVTTDGAYIKGAESKVLARYGLVNLSNAYPTLKLSATPSGNPAAVFSGIGCGLQYVDVRLGNHAAAPMNTIVTSSVKLIITAIKVSSAAAFSGTMNAADLVFADGQTSCGIFVTDDSGQVYVRGANFADTYAEHIVSQAINRDEFVIVTYSHQSNQLRMRVNGGAWDTSATTNTAFSLSSAPQIRSNGGTFEVAHIAVVNTAQTDAAISAVERWFANDLGITPW